MAINVKCGSQKTLKLAWNKSAIKIFDSDCMKRKSMNKNQQ